MKSKTPSILLGPRLPVILDGIPIMYEDEEEDDMGEADYHFWTMQVLYGCVGAFLRSRLPELQAFANMNCYYHRKGPRHRRTGSKPYISADLMVVRPNKHLPRQVVSYTIGIDGPTPLAAVEILSRSSAKTRDRKEKFVIYGKLGISEYMLVDLTGTFLPERLLMHRLQPDRTWIEEQDDDGGITSDLGFRLLSADVNDLAVIDAQTGHRYALPDAAEEEAERANEEAERANEAEDRAQEAVQAQQQAEEKMRAEAKKRRQAEEKVRALQAELERLRRS